MTTRRVGKDITVLGDALEVPGIGFIPVNAFVLHAQEPVVVDTGLSLPDRDFLLNPGQTLDVGDRTLTAFRPPLFDNPATVGFYDDRTRACFSSDCFGSPLPDADFAAGGDAGAVGPEELRAGQLLWASVDSPWACVADRDKFLATVAPVKEMDPEIVLSTHLPPATGIGLIARMLDTVGLAPGLDPFVGPDQQALEQMLAGFQPA